MSTKKARVAPRAESESQHRNQNGQKTVNTTTAPTCKTPMTLTTAEFTELDWKKVSSPVIVLVTCTEAGCYGFGTQHVLEWGDLLKHTAYVASNEADVRIEVSKISHCREIPVAEADWYVTGFLIDDTKRLTPERVAFFTAHYNSAVALAAELNGESR